MKLFIKENDSLRILDYNEPIKLDSEYINDYLGSNEATERNIETYSSLPIFTDLKADIKQMCEEIKSIIEDRFDTEYVKVESSARTGISTYITVKFKMPSSTDDDVIPYLQRDRNFLNHYIYGINNEGNGMGGEYKLEFRVSTHRINDTESNVSINAHNKTYSDIKDIILHYVTERDEYIKNAWNTYKQNQTLPHNQSTRNRIRAKRSNQPQWTELYKHLKSHIYRILAESNTSKSYSVFTSEIDNIFNCLQFCNVYLYDIFDLVESKFYNYSPHCTLWKTCIEALIENITEYTIEDSFNYDLLFSDIENRLL